MKTLKNQDLAIQVAAHGAELCSIVRNGKEYLWQADPAFWARHSPVLFPIVGRVWNDTYRVEGKEYRLSQHGFARDMDFTLTHESADELRYRLESSEATLEKYPYPFALEIGYRLKGRCIEVLWQVQNTGDREMPFQIGAHPAFVYQDFDPADDERGYFAFDRAQGLEYICPVEKGCVSPERHKLTTEAGGLMPIRTATFDCDTYIFDGGQLQEVTLLDKAKRPYLSLHFDTPLVALWAPTKAKPDCPFVCIEPWYGRADRVGYEGEYAERDHMQRLAAGETFRGGYAIEIK